MKIRVIVLIGRRRTSLVERQSKMKVFSTIDSTSSYEGGTGMKRHWTVLVLAVALLLGTALAAHGQSGPVVIGSLMSLTGGLAPYGIPIQNAIDLVTNDINAQGG